jgi:Cof subfamily protein (haloacid dehalogenase superfamily)
MNFPIPKGIIALDIDGTVTTEAHAVPFQVIDYLSSLANNGWKIIFITGRPFQWSYTALHTLPFTYILAVQNGALLIELPSKEVLIRKYLNKLIIPRMEAICTKFGTDFIIYSGLENGDVAYYRPAKMSPVLLSYVQKRTAALGEIWQAVDSFHDLPIEVFSSVKCFADEPQALALSEEIEKLGLHAPPNRDPFDSHYFVIQGTHHDATKGIALKSYVKKFDQNIPIIAAGDDYNDLSMLLVADVKVVMANAPNSLLEMADVIAPSALENGVIEGLTKAIKKTEELKRK